MDLSLEHLDFIDLVSERHRQLRKKCQYMWNENHGEHISDSEWALMERLTGNETTISDMAKRLDITRQATHKIVCNLQEKGLIILQEAENNRKKKNIILTSLGMQFCKQHTEIKKDLIKKLKVDIGQERIAVMETILIDDWGMERT